MPQQIRQRTEQTIEYVPNGKKSESLDRGMVYREIVLKLSMQINDDDTNAIIPTDVRPGDEWAIVRNLELLLNSNDSIRYITGEQLQMLNLFWYGTPRRVSSLGKPDGAGTDFAIESYLILPFWMPRSVKPLDTALDARLLSDLKVRVDWGDVTSVVSTTGATLAEEPKIELFTLESFGIDGPFNTMRIFSQEYSELPVQDKFRVELPVGNMYRSFLLNTKDSDGNDLADAIGNIRLRSGSVIFADLDAKVIRNSFMQRNGIREGYSYDLGETFTFFASLNSDIDAWTYFDLVTDGLLTEAIDTLGFSSFVMELELLEEVETLNVLATEVIPLRSNGS